MSTNTLTERYVREVARHLPADQRDDVAAELRTTIADTVEGRDSPDRQGSAEHEVLTEMGDPIRLAGRYAGRPLALIGPGLYPTYIRLLVLLLSVVLPVVTAVFIVIDVVEGHGLGTVLGTAAAGVLTIGAHMIAWLTVVFALVERVQRRTGTGGDTASWSPDDLPDVRESNRSGIGAGISAVWYALLLGVIVWQHTAAPYPTDTDRVPVLDPGLWSGWIWPVLAGLAALVVLELVRAATRRPTFTLAAWYVGAEALFALPLAWIFYNQWIFNPEFLTHFNQDWTTPQEFYTAIALVILAVSAGGVFTRFREALGKA